MKHIRLILSVLLVVALLIGSVPTIAFALPESDGFALTEVEPTIDPRLPELFEREDGAPQTEYAPDDIVRVSIILDDESAIEKGYPAATIASDKAAANYRDKLCLEQEKVVDRIEQTVLDGDALEIITNLTLVANLVCADVKYSQIEQIETVEGVKEVVIEHIYQPLEEEQTTAEKIDAVEKAATEYTGAGSRIAIIDSGVNDKHQSFDADALNYSLRKSAPDADHNGTVDDRELAEYKESLHFMTKDDVLAAVNAKCLHVLPEHQSEGLYLSDKIPFAYNYADFNLRTRNEEAGIHGSHVSGIAAANAYVPVQGQGTEKTFVKAEDAGAMSGTAPDAQILNLKVMGSALCTDSVIATAIEDALVLGADVLNLSLGTSEVGFSCADSIFGGVFRQLTSQGILIMGAIGNDGSWVSENTKGRPNKLYSDDVNLSLCTPPSSYADLMGVAWADGAAVPSTINKYSAYGIPSSLMLQPEITAYGTQVNSVNGNTDSGYTALSGTSMASPDVAGAAAVVAQYLRTKQFGESSFLSRAQEQNGEINQGMIIGGLLMSTADPMFDPEGNYYSLLRQGAGLLNTKRATEAKSFIQVAGQSRGRVKAEVGDCPGGDNTFRYQFTLYNVSDTERSYVFKTNLFTEDTVNRDGVDYLADKTRPLAGRATYKIGDKMLDFDSRLSADVNRDGKTDADDAQALLDSLSGKNDGSDLDLRPEVADLDGDQKITTYDAHLILKGLRPFAVTVAAGEQVTVDVELCVTEDLKEHYPKGAYLEGFTSVIPVDCDQADADVTHTIPILGFCGNWSDPSMFDRNNFVESFSGKNDTIPYTQVPKSVYEINYMTYQDKDGNVLKQAVNLYDTENSIPLDKLALNPNDTIRSVQLTLIRPAGAMCFVIMTKDQSGKRHVEHIDAVYIHQTCAFPSPNSVSGWSRASVSLPVRASLNKMLKDSDVGEGDTIELGAVAIPEYYEQTPGKAINADRVRELIQTGALGEGAYLTTTVTLDGKAPTVEQVKPDGKTLRVTAKDEHSVAFIGLYSNNGAYAFEKYIPDGAEAAPELLAEFGTSSLQEGSSYNIVVGDYAGNRSMYRFTFGQKQDISGKVIANVRSSGSGQLGRGDWVAVSPDSYSYGNGIVFSSDTSAALAGADAADGYVWQAFENGSLCAAPLEDLNAKQFICDLSASGMQTVRDLSFNPTDKKLYATDGSDTLWQIDPMCGDVRQMPHLTVNGQSAALYGLAVNGAGEAVATHYDQSTKKSTLVRWKIDESADTAAAQTCTIGHRELSTMRYISLTWRNSSRSDLYAACADNLAWSDYKNYLYVISSINFENGYCTAYKPNSGFDNNMSLFYEAVRGLINLAAMPKLGLVKDGQAAAPAALRILGAKDRLVAGDTLQLTAALSPWNAQGVASVQWRAQGTASVDGNGLVTATGAGTATVTAMLQTDGGPLCASCEIEVKPAPDINVTAVFCEGNGVYYWENFSTARPNERKRLASSNAYTAGTLNRSGNCLYLFSGSWAYRVDPQTFRAQALDAAIDDTFHKHADAAPGRSEGFRTDFGYFTVENGGQTLLLGSRLDKAHENQKDCFDTVTVSLHTGRVNIGALAGIANAGVVETEDLSDFREKDKNPELEGDTYTADLYYVINESGDLFALYCYEAPRWYYDEKLDEPGKWADTEIVYEERIGHVDGVSLPGVSQMTNYATSSMIYDQESQMLVLVSKIGAGAAKVQVIDPKTHSLVMSRDFDDDVRQVGVLYQYDYSDITGSASASAHVSGEGSGEGKAYAENPGVAVDESEQTVTCRLTGENTTNGLTTVKYDPNVLTFRSLSASMPYHSYRVDNQTGTVIIAFADADRIETPSAEIQFTFRPQKTEQTTTLSVIENERGNPSDYPTPTEREQTVTLPAKTLRSISVSKLPAKTEYIEGQTLDTTGLEVTAIYSDGTEELLAQSDYTVRAPELSSVGRYTVTVEYQGVSATFEVTVKAKSMIGITVSKNPDKMEYVEGTPFDDTGMELTLRYDNGTEQTVDSGWQIGEYDFSAPGQKQVTVIYGEFTATLSVTVTGKSLTGIEVTTPPDKQVYLESSEQLDLSGGTLTLYYNNGTTEQIALSDQMIAGGFDNTKPGKQTVSVAYGGFTATFEVTVKAKSIDHIEITRNPDKMDYVEGTGFDPQGMEVTVYYDNAQTEVITEGWEIAYAFDKVGDSIVTVCYQGHDAHLTVNVSAKSIVSVAVSKDPDKTEYIEGTPFDDTGMELTLRYDNGTEQTVDSGWQIGGYDFSAPGQKQVTIIYGGFTATLSVTVTEKSLTGIEVTTPPDKQIYLESSDNLDLSGGTLTLYYNNGTTEQIALSDQMIAGGFDNTKPGKQTVSVAYGGFTATFEVTVKAKSIDHIEITRNPDKMDYVEGTGFDPQGMEVTVYYDNAQTEVITEGWEIAYAFDKVGDSIVTVCYQGHDAHLTVNVSAKSIVSVAVSKDPDKTEYIEGTPFDDTGMELTLRYDNGTEQTVDSGWQIGGYDFSAPGRKQVTVTYGGKSATLSVTVREKSLTGIEITKMPDNTEYTKNAEFDGVGIELTLYYDNGTTQTITKGWTADYDFSVSGQRQVKISYGGIEAGLTVTVKDSSQSPVIPGGKDDQDSKSPQTGDDSRRYIWLLLALSSGSMLALLAGRKKHGRSN